MRLVGMVEVVGVVRVVRVVGMVDVVGVVEMVGVVEVVGVGGGCACTAAYCSVGRLRGCSKRTAGL